MISLVLVDYNVRAIYTGDRGSALCTYNKLISAGLAKLAI